MWDDEPVHAAGICAACGLHTDDGLVTWVPRMSAADVRLIVHADPTACSAPVTPADPSPLPLRRL